MVEIRKAYSNAGYYNRHACELSALNEGDVIGMRLYKKGDHLWEKSVMDRSLARKTIIRSHIPTEGVSTRQTSSTKGH